MTTHDSSSSLESFYPLWVEGRKQFSLSEHTSISLPEFAFDESLIEDAVHTLKRLGYDTVILGSFARSEEASNPSSSVETRFKEIRDLGIRVGIKVSFDIDLITESLILTPFNQTFREFLEGEIERIFNALPAFDYLVYESLALIFDEMGLNKDNEHLISEIARFEIALIEKAIQGKADLIYIFPGEEPKGVCSQEHFLKQIAMDADSKTWLTFSSRRGNPFLDHLKIHPFLTNTSPEELQGFRFASIVNIGGILQGGGLWPSVTIDLIQSLYPLMIDMKVTPIPCVHGLPKPGSFLEASLVIASKAVRGSCFPEKDLFFWLKAVHQEHEIELIWQDLKEVRDICLHLSTMRALLFEKSRDAISQEEIKLLAASVFYRLKRLSKERKSSKREPAFQDYLHFFLRDAARIVLHFTQSFNITLQESFGQDTGKKGFWTEFAAKGGPGLRSFGKVSLFKTPLLEPGCLQMESVYKDAGWS